MTLALNKQKLDNFADEIWKFAQRLRCNFKAYEYHNVILPILLSTNTCGHSLKAQAVGGNRIKIGEISRKAQRTNGIVSRKLIFLDFVSRFAGTERVT